MVLIFSKGNRNHPLASIGFNYKMVGIDAELIVIFFPARASGFNQFVSRIKGRMAPIAVGKKFNYSAYLGTALNQYNISLANSFKQLVHVVEGEQVDDATLLISLAEIEAE